MESAYPDMTYLCAQTLKVKTKGVKKGRATKFARSTK